MSCIKRWQGDDAAVAEKFVHLALVGDGQHDGISRTRSEAKANLSHYGRSCRDEPIIVTVNGVPSFQLVPLSKDDDLIDSLLQHNSKFRQTLKNRLKEQSVSAKEARKRFAQRDAPGLPYNRCRALISKY